MGSVNLAILFVFIGCGSNVFFLEHLINLDPTSGNLITCCQFLFIALERLAHFKWDLKIPLKRHLLLVSLFVTVNVINNWAFSFKVPLTLHIVFRAGSLVTNLLLSRLILKRQFSKSKYISVATITLGIIICTLVTTPKKNSDDIDSSASNSDIVQGLVVMTIGLILSSTQGILQERTSIDYGKHPLESLFLHHFLALPTFWALKESIYTSIETYSNTELVNDQIPIAWLYLAGNLLTQYICIRSVFVLTTECPSLTVTLVVTLRKFFSLLVSVIYFKTYWGPYHWMGTFLVFGGTLLYAENIMSKVTSYFELNNNEKKLK